MKITKAMNSRMAYVKENLTQRTAYPKSSATHFKYAYHFFRLSGY